MSSPVTPRSCADIVRYVVVVHGIGEQKKNETVLPVIYRLAEARAEAASDRRPTPQRRRFGSPITRGVVASQLRQASAEDLSTGLEEGWAEFEGIPRDPKPGSSWPFVGRRSSRPGSNLRFVDLHWAPVMDEQFEAFGEPAKVWTQAVIDRLESREAPAWILEMMRALRGGVIPLQRVFNRRWPVRTARIFDRTVGDVQLYGEYLGTRGRAVRRFHERLAGLEKEHREAEVRSGLKREPRYTIIAHSLGSIMSFDALTFAHMRWPTNEEQRDWLREHLPEYDRAGSGDDLPDLGWIRNVDALVTLGSPIDKFLVLWWLNYEHLADPSWLSREFLGQPRERRIRHYNYCDSNDPVGHEIDVAYSEGTVTADLFVKGVVEGAEKPEDVVFSRYAGPGAAHTAYWTDDDLFRRILDLAIDGLPRPREEMRWFRWSAYFWGLVISYLLIPFVGWLAASAVFVWTFGRAGSWLGKSSGVALGIMIVLGTGWLLGLMIRWRAAVGAKEDGNADRLGPGERSLRGWLRGGLYALMVGLPFVWLWLLNGAARAQRGELPGSDDVDWLHGPVVWLAESLPAAAKNVAGWFGRGGALPDQGWILTAAVSVVALAFALASWRLFCLLRFWWRWCGYQPTIEFGDYLCDNDPTRPDPTAAEERG